MISQLYHLTSRSFAIAQTRDLYQADVSHGLFTSLIPFSSRRKRNFHSSLSQEHTTTGSSVLVMASRYNLQYRGLPAEIRLQI